MKRKVYECGHNLRWQVGRAEWRYLSQTLLTCQIDNLCSEGILCQLQSHPVALGISMEDMHCSQVLVIKLLHPKTDAGSDCNKVFRTTSHTIFRAFQQCGLGRGRGGRDLDRICQLQFLLFFQLNTSARAVIPQYETHIHLQVRPAAW